MNLVRHSISQRVYSRVRLEGTRPEISLLGDFIAYTYVNTNRALYKISKYGSVISPVWTKGGWVYYINDENGHAWGGEKYLPK